MQASKIIPGKVYAIQRGNELLRFRANEVVTIARRKSAKASPHDYTSEIHGFYVDEVLSDESTSRIKVVSPDDIKGEFSEFTELLERKKREDEEHKRVTKAKRDAARELAVALYAFIGQEAPAFVPKRPNDVFQKPSGTESYESLFRSGYDSVEIKQEGVALLLATLKNINAKAA